MQDQPTQASIDDDARRPAAVVVSGKPGAGRNSAGSSASPGLSGSGHSGRRAAPDPTVPLWQAVAGSLVLGTAVAFLGTALHAQVWNLAGAAFPWGAIASVILAGSAAVFAALWARSVYLAALVGGVAYALVGLLATSTDQQLILTDTGMDPVLPSAIAGSIWVFGLAIVTVLSVMVSWWVLRRSPGGRYPA